MEDRGKPVMYTCHMCQINFQSKKCPKCGKMGTLIYKDQIVVRPKNNPTDVNAFLIEKGTKVEYSDYRTLWTLFLVSSIFTLH